MNPTRSFVVSQFTNPSGKLVFRMSGWLYGKRIRKNFGTRAEAEAERQVYEIGSLQSSSGIFIIINFALRVWIFPQGDSARPNGD